MIRSELCVIAGIMPPTFNSHRRNGNLPFDISNEEVKDHAGRVWARFDMYHAALLIATQNLVAGQGVTWSEAAAILRAKAQYTDHGGMYREPGFHCARVEFRTLNGYAPSIWKQFKVYRGSLASIVDNANRECAAFNARARFDNDRIEIYSMAAVNLSQAWHIANARAEDMGIKDTGEGAPDPMAGV